MCAHARDEYVHQAAILKAAVPISLWRTGIWNLFTKVETGKKKKKTSTLDC